MTSSPVRSPRKEPADSNNTADDSQPKGFQLGGIAKPAALIVGATILAVLGFATLKTLTSAVSTQPAVVQKRSVFNLPSPAPAAPISQPSPSPSAQPSPTVSDQTWTELKASHASLEDSIAELKRKITRARGQKWLLFAVAECQRLGQPQCQSPRSYLLDAYMAQATQIQTDSRTGQVGLDAESVRQWRDRLSVLDDIATALILEVNGDVPANYVATADVSAKIDGMYSAASKFDSLRRVYNQEKSENQKPNTDNDSGFSGGSQP